MKKPKPPKSFQEVADYIQKKRLNVSPIAFWDYFEAGDWHDKFGSPVLNWKQKLLTWHGRDKRTKPAKTGSDDKRYKQRIREEYQPFLEAKSTRALLDLKQDGGHLAGLCGWLIDEILTERGKK